MQVSTSKQNLQIWCTVANFRICVLIARRHDFDGCQLLALNNTTPTPVYQERHIFRPQKSSICLCWSLLYQFCIISFVNICGIIHMSRVSSEIFHIVNYMLSSWKDNYNRKNVTMVRMMTGWHAQVTWRSNLTSYHAWKKNGHFADGNTVVLP